MQHLEVSCAVRLTYTSLGAKGLNNAVCKSTCKGSALPKIKGMNGQRFRYVLTQQIHMDTVSSDGLLRTV